MTDTGGRPDLAFAIGITEYDRPDVADLPSGAKEIRRVFDALASGGFVVDPEPLIGRADRDATLAHLAKVDKPARRLLVYWSGHGVSDDTGSWLFTSETDPDDPGGTGALDSRTVATVLGALYQASQVVMLLDCCGSGDAALDIATAITLSPPPDLPAHHTPPAVSLISATYGGDEARPMFFANAIADALTSGPPSMLWPAQKSEISPQELAEAASAWLRTNLVSRSQRARGVGVSSGTGFFANPAYDPNTRDVLIGSDLSIRRGTVLDDVRSWHRSASRGLFLLTGSMGTGKSTVVNQLVEEHADDVAWTKIALTKMDLRSVTAELALRLQLNGAGELLPETLIETYSGTGQRGNLAFDSLDEAEPESGLEIVRRLLLPLAALPGVHVLVSHRAVTGQTGRPDGVAELQAAATGHSDLDADPTAEREIRRLATRILEATPHSPYRRDADLARRIAAVIAARSGGIFYLAAYVAHRLARESSIYEPDDEELAEMLTAGIGGAISRDFRERGVDADRLLDVLTPLTWAAGTGVPVHDVWPAMVNALRPHGSPALTKGDIRNLLGEIGEFVTGVPSGPDAAPGDHVYRLRHLAIAEYLRARAGRTDEEAHQLIAAALKPAIGEWPAAPPYVLDHLVEHADRGGTLLDLFADPDFMVFSEPRRTLAAVTRAERSNRRSPTLDLYLRAAARLADNPIDMRVFLLQSLRREGRRTDAPEGRRFSVSAPCRTRWTTASSPSSHRLIRIGPERLDGFTAIRTASGSRLVTASKTPRTGGSTAESGIEVWDPSFTAPLQVLRGRAGKEITAMAAAPYQQEDEMLVVAYGRRNNLLEARLIGGDRVLWTRHDVEAYELSCVWAGGSWAVAATDLSHVRLFRASDGHPLGAIGGAGGYPKSVIGFHTRGINVICVVTDWELTFWDAAGLRHLGLVRLGRPWSVATVVHHDQAPMIVGGRDDGRLELRDAATGLSIAVAADDLGDIADRMIGLGSSVAVAAGAEVSWWRTQPIERAFRYNGHAARVAGLGVVRDETGHEYIASAAEDGSVRVWTDTRSIRWDRWDSDPITGDFERVHAARVGGRAVILVEDALSFVLVDQDDGSFLSRTDKKHFRSQAESMSSDLDRYDVWAVALLGNDSVAVAGQHQGAQVMWSVDNLTDYALPTPGAPYDRDARALVHTPGGPLLVSGGGRHPVGVFRVTGGLQCWLDCPAGSSPQSAVAAAGSDLVLVQLPDGDLVVHDPVDGKARARIPLGNPDSPFQVPLESPRNCTATARTHSAITADWGNHSS
ncbi:hypothetical protein [Streptomyces sp. SD15]